MARYEVTGPDGRRFEVTAPEDASEDDLFGYVQQTYYAPKPAGPKPDTGFTGALKASTEELKGDIAALAGRLGITDIAEAEKYREAQKKKAAETFAPTEEGWAEAPWTKFKETLGGSLPYMAAPVAAAGAATVAGAPSLAAAGAAGLASLGQFTATNISRQVDEGKKLGDTDLLAAGSAAIPQAALDTLSFRMMPGIQRIFGAAGLRLTEKEAADLAKRGILSNAGDLTLQGAKVAGIEGSTEAAQQFFERLQAGLNLTDPDARREYYENFIGGAALGGVFGAAGRVYERTFPRIEKPEATPAAPPAEEDETKALGYSPLAGTPIVFPDGTVALTGEQELAQRYSEAAPKEPVQADMFAADKEREEISQRFKQRYGESMPGTTGLEGTEVGPIPEPTPATKLTADVLDKTGLKKQSGFYKELLDKDLTNPQDQIVVGQILSRVRANSNLSQSTKDGIESIALQGFRAAATQKELFVQKGKKEGEATKEAKATGAPTPAPKETVKPQEDVITEADLKDMGIGPSNKALRETVLDKDLTDPEQRAIVKQTLEEYGGAEKRSPRIASKVEAFLSKPVFQEEAKGAEYVTRPTEPVGGAVPGAVEPSVPAPVQPAARAEVPATPVRKRVAVPSESAGLSDAGKRNEQRALKRAENLLGDYFTQTGSVQKALDYIAGDLYVGQNKKTANTVYKTLSTSERKYIDEKVAEFKRMEQRDRMGRYKRGKEIKYRIATAGTKGNSKDVVQKLVDKIKSGWVNAPEMRVVQSINELPDYMQEQIRKDGVNPKGAFDPNTQAVYIVSDNITGYTDALLTVAHEAIGHYGLRSVLGKAYDNTLGNLYNTNKEIKRSANKKMKEGLDKLTAVEETLAEAIEEKIPPSTRLGSAVQRIKNLIRAALQKFGVKTINDKEVQALLDQFAAYVIEGKGERGAGPARAGEAVFRRGEPALTAAGQKAQETLSKLAGISNEKSKMPEMSTMQKVGAFFFDPAFRQNQIDKVRVQVAYKGASVERKLLDAYNGAIRDSLGNIRPDLFMTAAEHSDTLTVAAMKLGGIRLDKNIGWVATEGKASLESVFGQIKKLGERLGSQDLAFKLANDAFIARRANALKNHPDVEVSSLPDQAKIDAGLQAFKDFPELEKAFNEFTEYKNGLIDSMVEGGRLSPEKAKSWKDAADYVPWNRIKEYEENVQNSPKMYFKGLVNLGDMGKIKGGTDEINNIFDNMVGLSFWMVNSAVRNHAAVQLTDAFVQNKLGARQVRPGQPDVDPNKTIYFYRDGTPEVYEFDSMADVYAFKGVESVGGPLIKSFTTFSNFLRKTTTATPQFAVSQLFQDSYRSMVMSGVKNPLTVGAKVVQGFISAYRGDATTQQLERMGIVGMYDLMPGRAKEEIEKEFGIKQRSLMDKTIGKMESFSIASDAALRKAVFEQTLAETKSDQFPDGDVLLARMRAQEVINFKRQGAMKFVGVMRQIVPFMNAYIQGMDVFYRTMTGRGIAATERTAAFKLFVGTGMKLATLSMIYAMMVGDDEEYQGLREWEKDKNFVFPGTGIKIPVAPEVGFLFKVIPERMVNYVSSQGTERPQDATALRKAFATAAFDSFSGPNLTPQFVKPMLEVGVNYSFFTGAPVVGRGMEKLEPEKQFTEATSELAKMIGGLSGVSPLKLEYLFRGYTGIAGGTLLDVSNMMFTDRPDKDLYELPGFKTFMYDKIPGGYKEQYYDLRERVDIVNNTMNALKAQGRADELKEYLSDEKLQLLALKKVVNKIDTQLEKSRKLKKIIASDPSMSGEEKKRAMDEIDKSDNELLRLYNLPALRKEVGGL